MVKAVTGTWFVASAFALLGLGCNVLEEGPLVYGPTETRQAAGDTLVLVASWTGVCRPNKVAIGSGSTSCPAVDFDAEVTCSRAGCDAVVEKMAEDGRRPIELTLPIDPGPLDITITLKRADGDDSHSESFPVTIHRLTGVDFECSAAGCPSDWANVVAGERGAVELGVVGVSQEDGEAVFPSYTARFEPEDGQPAMEILPHHRQTCAAAASCVSISSPGILQVSSAGFERRAIFAGDGAFTVE